MLRICMLSSLLLMSFIVWAQATKKTSTGKFSGPFTMPLSSSTSKDDIGKPSWDIVFQSLPNEEIEHLFHTEELKKIKMAQKLSSIPTGNSSNKTAASAPIIGVNFKGNELKSWTPTDNSIAVSNGGQIVSCVNYGIEYYDTTGGAFIVSQTWNAFVNDTTLKSGKFDPRVIYDKLHDRFILVLLHGFSSTKSKILTFFSKTNNPLDGWYLYQLPGNPYNDTTWTDFPTIGVNNDELFINGNRFGDAPTYNWKETYIYQIGLTEGYAGLPLNYGLWNGIFTPDSLDGITLYPAANGLGDSMKEKMYFVQLMPDSGSHVYLYEINGLQSSTSKTLTASQFAIPHFEVCANAFQKDPFTGFVDSLSTGSSWTQNAFYLNKTIHFTFDADIAGGWCGVHYGRIYLDSNKAVVTSYGEAGTDFCYPALASLGYDSLDASVAIAYVRSDTSTTFTPETGVLSLDHAMTWSTPQTVKSGDTSVNILYPPTYAIQPERWGDYTGICRKYVSGAPQVWMAGAYGANTPPRLNSFGTWIAQIVTAESQPVGLQDISKSSTHTKVYPNPITDMFTLEFENNKAGYIVVELIDVNGRTIKTLFEDYLSESKNRIAFNKMMLARGNYFLIINRNGQLISSTKLSMN